MNVSESVCVDASESESMSERKNKRASVHAWLAVLVTARVCMCGVV